MSLQPFTFLMQGGLDLVTPRIAARPGYLLACQNYESAERGYRRVDGYERFSGKVKPSDATYHYATFTAGNLSLPQGTVVTGATSGATGIFVAAPTVSSGSYGGSNAVGYVGIYVTSGTFQNGEGVQSGGITRMTLSAAPVERGAPTDIIDQTLLHSEMERRRALISKPVGSGAIRGVWTYMGDVYAFRDNAGATAGAMYKATTTGWVEQEAPERLSFTSGTNDFADGEEISQGGISATVIRSYRTSGTYGGGNAAGFIFIKDRSGGNFAAGAATGDASGAATLSGAQVAAPLAVGGRYRFKNYSFTGAASGTRMYWTDGVAFAKEFDGTDFIQINTTHLIPSIRPTHLAVQGNHLFLGYETGNLLFSSLGNPLEFIVTDDSGEIVFGSTLTGMEDGAASAMMTFGSGKISYLAGLDTDTFEMKDVSTNSGAKPDSIAMVGQLPYYLDDRGVRRLDAAQDFGDWKMGSVSELVAPLFKAKADAGVTCTAAIPVKSKNQVRFFFDDGSGVILYLGRKFPEITPFLLPIVVSCGCSGEDASGNETLFLGAEDGYVYQLDAGNNFDGAEVDAWFRPHFGSPNGNSNDKRWAGCAVECDAATTAQEAITFVAEYSYGDGLLVPSAEGVSSITGVGGIYDVDSWDDFTWDAPVQGTAWADLNGYGFNVSLAVRSELTYEDPHTVSSMSFTYSQRKLIRGRHSA